MDRIGAKISIDNEVKNYLDCRYISSCESVWHIMGYDIHFRDPPVERLSFHMEGEQSVTFKDGDLITELVDKHTVAETKFLKWMEYNKNHPEARKYLYAEFPRYYVWDLKLKVWKERKQFNNKVGRIYHVPIKIGPLYYLRIMLNHIRGATYFEDMWTVEGVIYLTYRDACFALGLLDDDKEYIYIIKEASFWGSGHFL